MMHHGDQCCLFRNAASAVLEVITGKRLDDKNAKNTIKIAIECMACKWMHGLILNVSIWEFQTEFSKITTMIVFGVLGINEGQ